MIILTANQFNQAAVYLNNSEVLYKNNIYIKETSFKQARAATEYCKLYESKNLLTIIVKQQNSLIIWLQKLNQTSASQETKALSNIKETITHPTDDTSIFQSLIAQSTIQSTPLSSAKTKKVVCKYRGQTYEVEEPIVETQQSKPERMYRGQPY